MIKKIQFVIVMLILLLGCYGISQYTEPQTVDIYRENIPQSGKPGKQDKEKKAEVLPDIYDTRENTQNPVVKNQGELGTCWAVATSSALEARLLPDEHFIYSADHISFHSNYSKNPNDGGDYTMSMAYLAGWQGPVLEKEDPYGDGKSPDGLFPVKHVQEIQMIKEKDIKAIKSAVYQYGAVQSSLYMDLQDTVSSSVYYNRLNSSYCYVGEEHSNHDVLIIGWDDHYPAGKFNAAINHNGAFICQNSWGEEFGEGGVFYISYEDENLGNNCVVYSGIEDIENFDRIYQTDLCGWVGQIGYADETCFFANVYRAEEDEQLEAAGFYATAPDSRYEIYVTENFHDEASLVKKRLVQSGAFKNGGYYTVKFEKPVYLKAGQDFAMIVKITTPGEKYPVATEYRADENTRTVDISDGQGYISPDGEKWTRTEERHSCNVCLKAYTKKGISQ